MILALCLCRNMSLSSGISVLEWLGQASRDPGDGPKPRRAWGEQSRQSQAQGCGVIECHASAFSSGVAVFTVQIRHSPGEMEEGISREGLGFLTPSGIGLLAARPPSVCPFVCLSIWLLSPITVKSPSVFTHLVATGVPPGSCRVPGLLGSTR